MFFFSSLSRSIQFKQVRVVWILYNPSDLLCNTICTRWISFCRAFVVLLLLCVCVQYLIYIGKFVSVSFLFRWNLGFWANRSGRGTRNWRMLMNKNAWKKRKVLHTNRHRINIETLMCRWLMTFCLMCAHFSTCSSFYSRSPKIWLRFYRVLRW